MARLGTLNGSLEARFTCSEHGSPRVRVQARPPLELRGPFAGAGVPDYFLRNTTAGLLDGDAYRVDVTAAAGTSVHVGASSASKVYAGESSLDVRLAVEPGALLVWGPHATILHAGASYCQETRLALAPGGRAILAEVLVLGRLARGERFQFQRLESLLEVSPPACEPLYSEAYSVTPGPDLIAGLAGHGVLVSVYALGFDPSEAGAGFEAALTATCLAGWSALPNGCGAVFRALSGSLSQGARFAEEALAGLLKRGERSPSLLIRP
ncbi:MAG TPA: urease accessory protein UreD [Dehalococcoidia bacterium]|nr:urease accessory protein UreD [Dehalococcoidia bacterium]